MNQEVKNILIVDDYPENLQAIAECFSVNKLDYKILKAPNGKIALNLLKSKKVDLVITDWEMPEMNGIELIKNIKTQDNLKDIPIIMCSGVMTTSENLQLALDTGASDFIRKPIDMVELLARTSSMLKLSDSISKINKQNIELENQNKQISIQKEEIRVAHEKVKSSINYASRIQKALMPGTEKVAAIFASSFLFYKPKDIVSGDYFWMRNYNNFILIAIADCTGHGVPGALMSMLGISFLNEIVSEDNAPYPNQILENLRIKVKSALQQNQQSYNVDDGIDIALCCIHKKSLMLNFAGAYNPLCIVRKKDSTSSKESVIAQNDVCSIIELKGDLQPIGVYKKERFFSAQSIQLMKTDKLYLFTDGFIDQIGVNGTFGKDRFYNLLLKICNENMTKQKELIDHAFEEWKGANQQLDDISIWGMEVDL